MITLRRTPQLAAFLTSASLVAAATTLLACSSPSPLSATDDGGSGIPGSSTPVAPTSPGSGGESDGGPTQGRDATSGVPPTSSSDASSGTTSGPGTDPTGWALVWNDEFDGPNGSAADTSKWNTETGNSGWSNNKELQYYTAGTTNAVVTDGSLVITATTQGASALKCQYGTCQYTSARLNTQGKFEQAYGRFEARIQIPKGQGLWPAFWALGNNIGSAGWPTCGEIDIMENVGKEPATNHGSLHGPGYSGGKALSGTIVSDGGALGDDFHVYDIEWAPDVIRFYLDGALYETRTNASVPAGDKWVYDHPFFIILNVAVGGTFPGNPNASTTFPQTMKVDYVRVYKSTTDGG